MPTMKISKRGLDFIKGFESFVAYPYDDLLAPVKGKYREWTGSPLKGTATIGYGHTNAAKHSLRVVPGISITEEEASEILDVDLDECEGDVNRLVKVPLSQGQFDALVSFTFNCGTGNLKKLIAPLNRGDYDGTRAKFALYTRSKGKVLNGLVRRRTGEVALWDADYDYAAKNLPAAPSNVPEQVDAPKAPVPMKTILSSATGTAVVLAGVQQVSDTVSAVSEPMKQAVGIVSGIGSIGPAVLVAVVAAAVAGGAVYFLMRRA